jgi:hypothetical protein
LFCNDTLPVSRVDREHLIHQCSNGHVWRESWRRFDTFAKICETEMDSRLPLRPLLAYLAAPHHTLGPYMLCLWSQSDASAHPSATGRSRDRIRRLQDARCPPRGEAMCGLRQHMAAIGLTRGETNGRLILQYNAVHTCKVLQFVKSRGYRTATDREFYRRYVSTAKGTRYNHR